MINAPWLAPTAADHPWEGISIEFSHNLIGSAHFIFKEFRLKRCMIPKCHRNDNSPSGSNWELPVEPTTCQLCNGIFFKNRPIISGRILTMIWQFILLKIMSLYLGLQDYTFIVQQIIACHGFHTVVYKYL